MTDVSHGKIMRSSLSGLENKQPLSEAEMHALRCEAFRAGIAVLVIREIVDPATRYGVIAECSRLYGKSNGQG